MNARSQNLGRRLDYFVTSKRLVDQICDNQIRDQVFGSDHCPSTLFLALSNDTDDEKNHSAQDSNIEHVSSLQLSDDDEDEQITFINHAAQDSNDDLQPLSQVYESARKSPQPDQTEMMDS